MIKAGHDGVYVLFLMAPRTSYVCILCRPAYAGHVIATSKQVTLQRYAVVRTAN